MTRFAMSVTLDGAGKPVACGPAADPVTPNATAPSVLISFDTAKVKTISNFRAALRMALTAVDSIGHGITG